jgi:2,3-diphosphopglycerate-independent phosphoglycerate mutase
VRYATEHRAGVVLARPPAGLSDAVTGTDPLKDGLPLRVCEATDASAAAAETAAIVNAVSAAFRRVLADHPVNAARVARGALPADALLLRGAGVAIDVPPLSATAGWPAVAAVAPTKIIAGLAATLGAVVLTPAGATGDYGTRVGAKVGAALDFVAAADARGESAFVLLHLKAVDDAGHDRDAPLKVAWTAVADRAAAALVAGLAGGRRLTRPALLAVTGDHATPVDYGDHSVEPVPFVAARADAVAAVLGEAALAAAAADALDPPPRPPLPPPPLVPGAPPPFDEVTAASGELGRFPGSEVVPLLRRLAEVWGEH